MKLIKELQTRPTIFLIIVIGIISICIVAVVIIMLIRLKNEKRVSRAAIELKKITNSIRAGLVHFVPEDDCKILYASKGFYDLLGYERLEARSLNKSNLLSFVDSRDIRIVDKLKENIDENFIRCEIRMLHKDGNLIHMLMNGNSSVGKDGKHTISAVFLDVSEQRHMQEQLLLEGERYRIATELSHAALFEYDLSKDEFQHTEKYREWFGRNPIISDFSKSIEKRRGFVHPDDWGIYLEMCKKMIEGKAYIEDELRLKDRSGVFIWCQVMGKTIFDDNKPLRVIGRLVNVDTQKRELEALEYKATRDPLTAVYNKEVTIKKIDKFINGNKNGIHMLMFIDFDNFKSVNDTYGHLAGDKVLIFIISRIKDIFTEGEIIGRMGGDEFVVFSGNILNIENGLKQAEVLRKSLDTTYVYNGQSIKISGSIGISLYPEAGLHCEQLIERADQALYKVKEQGKNNFMLYTPST